MPTWPVAIEEPENTRMSPRLQSFKLEMRVNFVVERQAMEVM